MAFELTADISVSIHYLEKGYAKKRRAIVRQLKKICDVTIENILDDKDNILESDANVDSHTSKLVKLGQRYFPILLLGGKDFGIVEIMWLLLQVKIKLKLTRNKVYSSVKETSLTPVHIHNHNR